MTYNVFSGTLNPTHFTSLHFTIECIQLPRELFRGDRMSAA